MLIGNNSWQLLEKEIICVYKKHAELLKKKHEVKLLLIWNWYSHFDYYCSEAKHNILSGWFFFNLTILFMILLFFSSSALQVLILQL